MADRRDGAEDQMRGAGKEIEGRVRNAIGGLRGDSAQQIKGKAKELEGRAQRKIGELEDDGILDVDD